MTYPKLTPILASGASVPRYLGDRFADCLNVKDFGAKGNGTADDTECVQDALDAAFQSGAMVYFPAGTYLCSQIESKVGFTMDSGAVLKAKGGIADTSPFVLVTGDNLAFGDIYIDCNSLELRRGILINCNYSYFRYIHVKNLHSGTNYGTGVYVTGGHNVFDSITILDFINDGYDNDSMPQGVTLPNTDGNTVNGNCFNNVYSKNARSTVVDNSIGRNFFGVVASYDCKDNGFYAVGSGYSFIGKIIYDGEDSALGCRHGSHVNIGEILVGRAGGGYTIFLGNTEEVNIGSIIVDDPEGINNVLGLNGHNADASGNRISADERVGCGKISIGSISGNLGYGSILYFNTATSASPWLSVDYLTIDSIDVEITWDPSGHSSSRSQFLNLAACKGFSLKSINIRLIMKSYDTVRTLYMTMPTDRLQFNSFLGGVIVSQLTASKELDTTTSYNIQTNNGLQSKIRYRGGYINSGNNIQFDANYPRIDGIYSISSPSTGEWRTGDIIISGRTIGPMMWRCRVGGTPGTWEAITGTDVSS